jgi:hypothetical protein
MTEQVLSTLGKLLRKSGERQTQALTWLLRVEMFGHGGPVVKDTISRTDVHIVDSGGSLGLVIP